jgi:hypothetical protein
MSEKNQTKICISLLSLISDDDFKQIYINMPLGNKLDDYQKIAVNVISFNEHSIITLQKFMDDNVNINDADMINTINNLSDITYLDFAYACASSTDLIRRCLKHSVIPLNNSIQALVHYECDETQGYASLDVSSCKLLLRNGCDIYNLLDITHNINNYNSVKFIINNMNVIELSKMLTSDKLFKNLYVILLIDKIISTKDKCLITSLEHKLTEYNFYCANIRLVAHCYYIIRYTNAHQGKNIMATYNDMLNAQIKTSRRKISIEQDKILYNNLLEFHFRPRGKHTKGANITTF